MQIEEREARAAKATELVPELAAKGVIAVATSFVDDSGISRAKAVPLRSLPALAAWGAGCSPSFDYFRFDDAYAGPLDGTAPLGDLRLLPDLRRVVPLAAQPGWAWAPGERYTQEGAPYERCSRLRLRRLVDALAVEGLQARAGIEIEWVVSAGDGDDFVPATSGPGYGLARLVEVSDYLRDLLEALDRQGVEVAQIHPEYGTGQLEISVAPEDPVEAADTSVLVRATIRAVGRRHGLRTSFSPKATLVGVGNGGHLHLSLWRGTENLMSGGPGRFGLTHGGEAFAAGILDHLPALMAIGAPSVASYLRQVPSHWAGVYACWGLENREAAVRMITGSAGSSGWAANLEIKCVDLAANPYLLLLASLAAGRAGIRTAERLPEPVDLDPAALTEEVRLTLGIRRLPQTLRDALDALLADDVVPQALGPGLVEAIASVRQSEIDLFAGASDEEIVRATRWAH